MAFHISCFQSRRLSRSTRPRPVEGAGGCSCASVAIKKAERECDG